MSVWLTMEGASTRALTPMVATPAHVTLGISCRMTDTAVRMLTSVVTPPSTISVMVTVSTLSVDTSVPAQTISSCYQAKLPYTAEKSQKHLVKTSLPITYRVTLTARIHRQTLA